MRSNLISIVNDYFCERAEEDTSIGLTGIEKESLRITSDGKRISQQPHPKLLGSALANKYITTDFCEAQLEVITLPEKNAKNSLDFLDDIHHFISCKIDKELLWPFSIPPDIEKEADIGIAAYGYSNMGVLKRVYRNGLSNRYGRMMQSISGVHYNFSLSDDLIEHISESIKAYTPQAIRSELYFSILRNINRMNWLILYLFGASPIITKGLIEHDKQSFQQLDKSTYFLPHATSLRMSEYGYRNLSQADIKISLNTIDSYISDLMKATSTNNKKFENISKGTHKEMQQLNSNTLQIEDEYYAVARAKSSDITERRSIFKLRDLGVDFIEYRGLDLNPFSRVGIDEETCHFLELFFTFCLLKDSKPLSDSETNNCLENDLLVAKQGRDPKIRLKKDGNTIYLKDWAKELLDQMIVMLDLNTKKSQEAKYIINKMRKRVDDSNQTTSGKLFNKIESSNIDYYDLGKSIADKNKEYYSTISEGENANWKLLEDETKLSLDQQEQLEKKQRQSFEDYLNEYLSN